MYRTIPAAARSLTGLMALAGLWLWGKQVAPFRSLGHRPNGFSGTGARDSAGGLGASPGRDGPPRNAFREHAPHGATWPHGLAFLGVGQQTFSLRRGHSC